MTNVVLPQSQTTFPTEKPLDEARSPELAAELTRVESTEKQERDRREQEELARLRELARFD